jgi:two-component system nitrogen regulation response regulator GlnG/two-component system response regulator HydG
MGAIHDGATTTVEGPIAAEGEATPDVELALALIWSDSDPGRIGELLIPRAEACWFGRDPGDVDEPWLRLVRQRPRANERAEPILNPFLSRRHLRIERVDEETFSVECAGRRKLEVNDRTFDRLIVRRGDVFEIEELYAFVCVERPSRLDAAPHVQAFGQPDDDGIVGESPIAWQLRRHVAFVAQRNAHVLITGPSGTGKELVARAIHRQSARHRRPLVARNAATLPGTLIDAELFGNCANYPNPGMPERPGLIGQADGSSLFLDEICELPTELQAHLLRVLDGGDYQRLGEARSRRADLRFMAATNRAPSELKHDLAARMTLRIDVPGLNERVEDIPLIARHVVLRICSKDPQLGERYLRNWDGQRGEPRLSAQLMQALVRHDYTTHVRELEALLWRSIESSSGRTLELTSDVRTQIRERAPARGPAEITADDLRASLQRNDGVLERVWRDLRLPNRHALRRLMRKHGEA